ncbi:MAG: hypothetical protein K2W82_14855 [Candidatus Obscuribacterales bacterium]|nr:hypothetical protein [Candidatus Obscuribacterales bacterium]
MKKSSILFLSAALLCLSLSSAAASDWSEELPPRAPEIKKNIQKVTVPLSGGSNTVLQGSASTIHEQAPYIQKREQAAQLARIDAEAGSFLARAKTDQIIPPAVFRAFIENNYPGFLLHAQNNERALVVVRGQWDNSTRPLQSLGLKYTTMKEKRLAEVDLSGVKVLIIDCAGQIPRLALQKIRDFVAHGGYLLSTDWTLNNTLAKAFPGYIQWSGENTDGSITDAFVVAPDSPLFKGLNSQRYTWKLDRMSQLVRVINPSRVRVLARSSRLAATDVQLRVLSDPLLAGALACEFNFGHGKVLHLVGHFENCANIFKLNLLPDPAPEAGISLRQVISTNFIIEGLRKEPQTNQELPGN